jgi:NADH:ubiquinone oxidoreductase subunit 6 (subunit J)
MNNISKDFILEQEFFSFFIKGGIVENKPFYFLIFLWTLIVFFGCVIVFAKNTIHCLLSLLNIFFFIAIILFLFNLQFISFAFLIVFVGAVLVLFIYVIIMVNVKGIQTQTQKLLKMQKI